MGLKAREMTLLYFTCVNILKSVRGTGDQSLDPHVCIVSAKMTNALRINRLVMHIDTPSA